jgi:large subunit ribosomal protein L6
MSEAAISSRVGRKPVMIPAGVEIKMEGRDLLVKGPKGQMVMPLHPSVKIELLQDQVKVHTSDEGYCRNGSGMRLKKSITGTVRSKISNIVQGVSAGFERKLILVGVGYRAQIKGTDLHLAIGFSHPVVIPAPQGITFEAPTVTEILVKGVDKHIVGHIASIIRAVRPPEPYKGKGIRYATEVVVRKETKKK